MEEGPAVLARAERQVFFAAVGLVFASFQLASSPQGLFLLWSFSVGVFSALAALRVLPCAPSVVNATRPRKRALAPSRPAGRQDVCPVCSQLGCNRHKGGEKSFLQAWDGLTVPQNVDDTLAEFLEDVLQRFVQSWYKDLAPDEAFGNELRVAIRYAAGGLLRRAQKLDIPYLVTGPMLKVAASHVYQLQQAQLRKPEAGEEELLAEFGAHTHVAMRGRFNDQRYFRHLGSGVMPLLLPEEVLGSSIMRELILELFAAKVFVPAMNFASKPDFINKVLAIVFDPNSRLVRTHGPASREVPLLANFARRRSCVPRPLHPPLSQLLGSPGTLYYLMQSMKADGTISILQTYLDLRELRNALRVPTSPSTVTQQLQSLMDGALCPSLPCHTPLTPELLRLIEQVLGSEENEEEKCKELSSSGAVEHALEEVFQLLEEAYYPRYCRSSECLEGHLGKVRGRERGRDKGEAGTPNSRRYDRWRRSRILTGAPSMEEFDRSSLGEVSDTDTGRDSPLGSPSPTSSAHPYSVQIVDTDTCLDTVKPYTVYIVLTRREGQDGKPSVKTVKRRFKEFIGLDARLRQFHGDTGVTLPRKRSLRNMEPEFVNSRAKDLEGYLNALIVLPEVRDGQLLSSFLDPVTEPAVFLPASMGDKAGRMIKAVPGRLKRERSIHVDEFALKLLQSVESPSPQASDELIEAVDERLKGNGEKSESYAKQVVDDLAVGRKRFCGGGEVPHGIPLPMRGIMDLLLYLAIDVYGCAQWQLVGVLVGRTLAQNSLDDLLHEFISEKVSLMAGEGKVVQLIDLLRDNLFNRPSSRTAADEKARLEALRAQLASHPTRLLSAVGKSAGSESLLSMLQFHSLNKQLLFTLLDTIVEELFPELCHTDSAL